MQPYSPFDKPLADLQTADLRELRQASEGWYIEYKQQTPNAAALAKSLSAFANTYGGWLFLGIQEESKEKPVAGAFPGLSREDVDPTLQRMRKSATDHLNPTPHFETKVFWGPHPEIGLTTDRAVICAWIPRSSSTPHVHKSGKIYRRVADASEPKAETDRFVLDQLWRRSDAIKRYHKDWYCRDPEFSEHEKARPFVRLMLVADRWLERDIWIDSEDDRVRDALAETAGLGSIPFDTVYTCADGFIGRQLSENDPQSLTLTWRLRQNLSSDVIVPMPFYQFGSLEVLAFELDGYCNVDRFIDILGQYRTSTLRIVDLNYLFNILIGVVEIQERLSNLVGWSESYFLKVKLLNSWRTVPYVDIPVVLERFQKQGLPMCLDSIVSRPDGTGPNDYVEIFRHNEIENPNYRTLIQALLMFSPLALSYGIPFLIREDDEGTVRLYYDELQEAGCRAVDVQQRRNRQEDR